MWDTCQEQKFIDADLLLKDAFNFIGDTIKSF